jgi:putative tryptophan/tyrosine transport system substrate-binding protein
MQRREFITLLGGATAWPLPARAQQIGTPAIGFLNSATREGLAPHLPVFLQALNEIGFVEGRNMTVVYGWADNDNRRLATLAAEFVGRQAAVITAPSIAAALAAKSATATIPIVFYTGADPVGLGLVASLNRPNGNLTGVTGLGTELGSKRVELLHELLPAATAVALLVNGSNSALAEPTIRDAQAAARTLGLKLHVQDARTEDEIAVAFVKSVELRAGGLVVGADNFFNAKSGQLAALALRHGLPTIYQYRDFTAAGGLMSYGGSLSDAYRLVGLYTGRILKGEKPGDLPVQQATKVELIINMRTAKVLGLAVPITLLGRADEVIE